MNLSRASSMLAFGYEDGYWSRDDVGQMEEYICLHVMLGLSQGAMWVIAREKAAVRLRPVAR